MSDQVPSMDHKGGGSGVQVQRQEVPMSDQRPFTRAKGEGGQGVQRQRDPEQRGPFATGKLSSPFPYFGGKSRWIDTVWQRLGKVGVFAEPCCGTAVMMLNNPEPAPREVICDLNAYICNFYRALRADPDAVAYWADWPTNHHDLTARHRWLLVQGPELSERMTADPDDFDPKIAGWWVWGQSSWIGHGWCDGQARDQMPFPVQGGGSGVQQQRTNLLVEDKRLPVVRDQIPAVGGSTGQGAGVQQHRTLLPVQDKRPQIEPCGGGRGVQQQRDRVPHVKDKMPLVQTSSSGGQGVSAQRADVPGDQIPHVHDHDGGKGVQQQRDRVPGDQRPFANHRGQGQGVQQQRDKMPHIHDHDGGKGVQQQRDRVPGDRVPSMPAKGGQGVQQQRSDLPRDGIPHVQAAGRGRGVNIQRSGADHHGGESPIAETDGILDGSRMRPWFRAIAERLARVIILNRSWESALTDSVLQQTPSSPKPSVGVFLDPPYRTTRADGGKRSTGLYQGDTAAASDDVAAATYEWATEGRNKLGERYADKYRIAYCMHEGDFPIPPGWTFEVMGFSGHRDQEKKKELDCVMFSPACVPVPVDPQLGFGW